MPKPSDTQTMNTLATHLVAKAKGTLIAPQEVLKKIETLSPEAVDTLEHLMRNSKADTVRLKAALEVLQLAGVSKETRLTIKTETRELSDEELDTKLEGLLRRAGSSAIDVLEAEDAIIIEEDEDDEEEG